MEAVVGTPLRDKPITSGAAADLLMADVLRVPALRDFAASPVIDAYIDRACDRDSFTKAFADQLTHFRAADAKRATSER